MSSQLENALFSVAFCESGSFSEAFSAIARTQKKNRITNYESEKYHLVKPLISKLEAVVNILENLSFR